MDEMIIIRHPFEMSRRSFLKLSALSSAAFLAGCAVNPVTGQNQLMLVSEQGEISIDRENSPHQFSADYGISRDRKLNAYLDSVGRRVAAGTHRPGMPYNFQAVNAAYVNAYAFPGGSIAATRGILIVMESEAELASLLGHELGHVNARHTAQRMTAGMVASLIVAGATAYAGRKGEDYADLAAGLGQVAAGALLAKYSRDDERQADSLGFDYMIKAGYDPRGQVDLMDMLRSLSKHRPNVIEMMFATHPMSDERYNTVVRRMSGVSPPVRNLPLERERYMDSTAGLRAMKGAIENMQNGDRAMMKKQYDEAGKLYGAALKEAPEDYAALVMMAKCQLALKKYEDARCFADSAKAVYPGEAQAHHVGGLADMYLRQFDRAYDEFSRYQKLLPGNPNTIFFKGLAQEGMGHREEAAREYYRYLQQVQQGDQARHAYMRLVEWGYIKEEPQAK